LSDVQLLWQYMFRTFIVGVDVDIWC